MKRGFMEKILKDTWFMHPSTITGLFINFVKSGGFFLKNVILKTFFKFFKPF